MDLSDLTLEEALQKGIITKGRWNDPDWEVDEPEWRKALRFAEKYHAEAGSTYMDKSGNIRFGKETPYFKFIQGVLGILYGEVNLVNEDLLTIAALYKILELTACEEKTIEKEFDKDILESVKLLQNGNRFTFGERLQYLAELDAPRGQKLTYIFLAVKLMEERVIDICPLESWEKDIPHYTHIAEELEQYGLAVCRKKHWNRAIFLGEKILKQLEKNKRHSRNCNKTAEELYKGWIEG